MVLGEFASGTAPCWQHGQVCATFGSLHPLDSSNTILAGTSASVGLHAMFFLHCCAVDIFLENYHLHEQLQEKRPNIAVISQSHKELEDEGCLSQMLHSAGEDNPLWRFLVLINVDTSRFALTGLMSRVVSGRAIDFRNVNVAIVSIAHTKQHKEVVPEHM